MVTHHWHAAGEIGNPNGTGTHHTGFLEVLVLSVATAFLSSNVGVASTLKDCLLSV